MRRDDDLIKRPADPLRINKQFNVIIGIKTCRIVPDSLEFLHEWFAADAVYDQFAVIRCQRYFRQRRCRLPFETVAVIFEKSIESKFFAEIF